MVQVQALADQNPKTCSLKSKSMNLQTIHKTFPALLKMMLPTGQQQYLFIISYRDVTNGDFRVLRLLGSNVLLHNTMDG